MKKYLLIFLLGLCCIRYTHAQDTIIRCATGSQPNALQQTDPKAHGNFLRLNEQIAHTIAARTALRSTAAYDQLTIPVVVHVIHNVASGTIGGSNISDAQIQSQIDVLNKDYNRLNADTTNTPAAFKSIGASVQLTFCLANTDPDGHSTNGITRTYSSTSSFNASTVRTDVSDIIYWPSSQYLNIWIVNSMKDGGTTVLGYGTLPGTTNEREDGVVIYYKSFGTVGTLDPKYNLGRTATHEVGHWLNLLHTWGDVSTCNGTDYCNDTPVCNNSYFSPRPSCPSTPDQSCTSRRLIEDYMDYSDDMCMNLFTEDQKARMRTTLDTDPRRIAIKSSLGCCVISNLAIAPLSKSFEDGSLTSDGWYTINPNSSSMYTPGFELNNNSSYEEGSYAAAVMNDSVYTAADPNTHKYMFSYVSPFISVQASTLPKLRFDWAYSARAANGSTDSILVYIATGCASNWQPLYSFYGSGFTSTANPRAGFVPDADEWSTTEIDLSAYKNVPAIRVKFVAYSKGINTFYLDNINIANASNQLLVNVYPVPTSGLVNVSATFNGKKRIRYVVYNVLGQLIYEATEQDVYSNVKALNLSFLASGVYFLQVTDGTDKVLKRIVKQ